jgi:hypothetical protein
MATGIGGFEPRTIQPVAQSIYQTTPRRLRA